MGDAATERGSAPNLSGVGQTRRARTPYRGRRGTARRIEATPRRCHHSAAGWSAYRRRPGALTVPRPRLVETMAGMRARALRATVP